MKICMKVFWNPADSKNAVRSSSEAEKISKFDIQNLDIAKIWSFLDRNFGKIDQNLATSKFWMSNFESFSASFKLLTVFFESAAFQKGYV